LGKGLIFGSGPLLSGVLKYENMYCWRIVNSCFEIPKKKKWRSRKGAVVSLYMYRSLFNGRGGSFGFFCCSSGESGLAWRLWRCMWLRKWIIMGLSMG